MKKHFDGNPIREPSNESRNQGDQYEPVVHAVLNFCKGNFLPFIQNVFWQRKQLS
jgi:hypothetical protein